MGKVTVKTRRKSTVVKTVAERRDIRIQGAPRELHDALELFMAQEKIKGVRLLKGEACVRIIAQALNVNLHGTR